VGVPAGCAGPADGGCAFANQDGPGICDPPRDLSCDGTGSNQHFVDFITALINHVGPGKIAYWELWNEPNVTSEWNAGADCPGVANAEFLMLARMAHDLRTVVSAVDPQARFTTPAPARGVSGPSSWLGQYLMLTDGGSVADIIAFHGYVQNGTCPNVCPIPEDVLLLIKNLKNVLPTDQQLKPLFDTEGSWGDFNRVSTITDPDMQAAFMARYYLVQLGIGVTKLYWYGWDFSDTGLYDTTTNSLNQAGLAYQQVLSWTSGATVQPCVTSSSIWTCTIAGIDGTISEVIWDVSQNCGNGSCSSNSINVPAQFAAYFDLSGGKHPIANGTAPIGAKPIRLVNR
jgi:hypothetical protein